MKALLIGAALLSAGFVSINPALAADAAPVTAAAATLNGDSPIEAIAALPAGKAALEAHVSGVLSHPAYEQFKGMSLRALAPMSGGLITDEKIAALEADLKAAK